jgi:hypothetical protein
LIRRRLCLKIETWGTQGLVNQISGHATGIP